MTRTKALPWLTQPNTSHRGSPAQPSIRAERPAHGNISSGESDGRPITEADHLYHLDDADVLEEAGVSAANGLTDGLLPSSVLGNDVAYTHTAPNRGSLSPPTLQVFRQRFQPSYTNLRPYTLSEDGSVNFIQGNQIRPSHSSGPNTTNDLASYNEDFPPLSDFTGVPQSPDGDALQSRSQSETNAASQGYPSSFWSHTPEENTDLDEATGWTSAVSQDSQRDNHSLGYQTNGLTERYRAMPLPSQDTTVSPPPSQGIPSLPNNHQTSSLARVFNIPTSPRRRIATQMMRARSKLFGRNREARSSSVEPRGNDSSDEDMGDLVTPVAQRKRRRSQSPPDPPISGGHNSSYQPAADRQSLDDIQLAHASTPAESRSTLFEDYLNSGRLARGAYSQTQRGRRADFNMLSRLTDISSDATLQQYIRRGGELPLLQQLHSLLPSQIRNTRSSFVYYISQLYPRSFSKTKRSTLNHIFRNQINYVPSAIACVTGLNNPLVYYVSEGQTFYATKQKDLPLGPGRRGWPAGQLPTETFHSIAQYLPRESLEAMRLVNGEFEMKISNLLFHTVVVPFRSEIYGMMTQKTEDEGKPLIFEGKGKVERKSYDKGKARADLDEAIEDEKPVHDGMKVFEAWGPHIKRYAMAFEIDETTLENAPTKGKFEQHVAWWGAYQWPHPYYNRYEFCEGLEKKADEFKCMSKALSHLQGIRELGLSLDSGLGWLAGPDASDRARMFRDKPDVFGRTKSSLKADEVERMWKDLVRSVEPQSMRSPSFIPNDEGHVEMQVNMRGSRKQITFPDSKETRYPMIFEGENVVPTSDEANMVDRFQLIAQGASAVKDNGGHFAGSRLKPRELSIAQQEWLLETEWAQRAFLSSFCMALSDNSKAFSNISTLNFSKVSGRYLSALQREDIWLALPNVHHLTLHISADWRNIVKTDTGIVESPLIQPSKAATQFYTLLKSNIAQLQSITSLSIGYTSGGEHETGIFGRNKGVLPAPIANYSNAGTIFEQFAQINDSLKLPHVRNLTLTNCWLTPSFLSQFISSTHTPSLRQLSLKSISLTSSHNKSTEAPTTDHTFGIYDQPQGPPRRGDPSLGNLFSLIIPPSTFVYDWINEGPRLGSWPSVIDAITPGPTLELIRYALHYRDYPPTAPSNRPVELECITFDSCGYVRLTNSTIFDQRDIGDPVDQIPVSLARRSAELAPYMLKGEGDMLLGQIVPLIKPEEKEVFVTAFPMTMGWGPAEMEKAKHNREDGQPDGGTGRFRGVLEKLVLPEVEE